ncbi:MAG: redoxin domain-containing protein [Rikenellaceae bacterium]|jgi:thioredoxin-like negative regulator of GroEL|nr:redoxin domain-containing protein [Rikenellaceae bacterium]
MNTIHLTTEEFLERVADFENGHKWDYRGVRPAIVTFYADWCPYCRAIAPVLEQLARDYDGRLDVYKVNVDTDILVAVTYGANIIPSTLLFCSGHKPQIIRGKIDASEMERTIERAFFRHAVQSKRVPAEINA